MNYYQMLYDEDGVPIYHSYYRLMAVIVHRYDGAKDQ